MHRLLLIPLLASVLAAEDTAIVHPGVGVAGLSEDQAKDLFLGRKSTWDDGSKVVIAIAKSGPGVDALMAFLGKSPQQFQTSWKKLVFTGKGSMPEQLDNDEAVAAFVAKTPGAIGWADKAKAGSAKAVPVK